jgi:signal transduction histidine kinase
MPRTLENHTLHFSIEELASQLKVAGGLTIKFTYNNQVPALSKAFEIACFRIIQEFVNNAMKHGKASEVFLAIELDSKKQMLLVELTDNGCGFDQNSPNFQFGMGLKNIRTRVESYYGKMLLESKIDLGTRIKLEFPISFLIL